MDFRRHISRWIEAYPNPFRRIFDCRRDNLAQAPPSLISLVTMNAIRQNTKGNFRRFEGRRVGLWKSSDDRYSIVTLLRLAHSSRTRVIQEPGRKCINWEQMALPRSCLNSLLSK